MVTVAPAFAGFGATTSVVFVPICVTISTSPTELLPLLFVSPAYAATMVCVPGVSAAVGSVAMPLAFRALVPSKLVPSAVKVTLPVGASVLLPVTVAVKVTVVPTGTGSCARRNRRGGGRLVDYFIHGV